MKSLYLFIGSFMWTKLGFKIVKYIMNNNSLKKFYSNADVLKLQIINEQKGKSGIYQWVNNTTHESYIGSSLDLRGRLIKYYDYNHISNKIKGQSRIHNSLLKYGYSNFSLNILEYIEINEITDKLKIKNILLEREQHYIDLIKPELNILKIAGSNLGLKLSEEAKAKMSLAKKGKPSHRKKC
jgi:group I intron endonuclease